VGGGANGRFVRHPALYSKAAGIIPVVSALVAKGAALGTVLAFMMSVVALSLPEMLILKRVIKTPLILMFNGVQVAVVEPCKGVKFLLTGLTYTMFAENGRFSSNDLSTLNTH